MATKEIAANARAAFAKMGMSPQARAREKIAESCLWIYRNGFTSPQVLQSLMGVQTRGSVARNLVNRGLAKSKYIEGGGLLRGVPRYGITLTELGEEVALSRAEMQLPYHFEPYRMIPASLVRHNILLQFLTLDAVQSGRATGYYTERELVQMNADATTRRKSNLGKKIPDALWFIGNDRAAIELELSPKWGNRFENFALDLLDGIRDGRWESVIIYMTSTQSHVRYTESLAAGASLHRWVLSPSRHLVTQGNPRIITERDASKFSVVLLDGLE